MLEGPKDQAPPGGVGIWEHFTMQDGLPDMKIECLFEDSGGRLWIGTHDRGVVCYGGDEFKSFNRRDGLSGDGVFSIVEDQEGNLWFGTNQGLTRYNGSAFEVVGMDTPCSFLWGSCRDREGALWFGLERQPGEPPAVCRWDGKRLEKIPVADRAGPAGESIRKIIADEQGRLWIGGDRLYRLGEEGFAAFAIPSAQAGGILDLLAWPDGRLWAIAENGLWAFDGSAFNRIREERIGCGPISMTRDPSGGGWITTYDGRVLRYDGSNFWLIHHLNTVIRGGLCLDRVGRLWVGTYGMGLYCYDPTRVQIFRREQGLPAEGVNCLAETRDGSLWIGTRSGLARYDGERFHLVSGDERLEGNEITSLLVDQKDRLWIGNRSAYLFVGEGEAIRLVSLIEGIQGYRLGSLAEDGEGRIWFGAPHGKGFGYWAEGKVVHFPPAEGAPYPAWIGALLTDRQGNLWLGSANPVNWPGLCRYDGRSFARAGEIAGCSVLALCEGRDGRLWIGTNEGVGCYDGKEISFFTRRDGLSCEIAAAIFQAADGTLWVGTEGGGVYCYDGQVFQALQIPGEPACNVVHAIHQDRRGHLWLGTQGGLIRYAPRRLKPVVEVTEVIADNVYPALAEVRFPTSGGRVRICFRGRSPLERSSYLMYRYRLRGCDKDWQQTRLREVEYPQLKPGDYTFEVQAVDRELNYSEVAEVELRVTEDPRVEALTEALRTGSIRGEFIGESAALREVRRQIQEIARTELTVLIQGETGTGKGLAARAIHELSRRKQGPFIHVNCGGLHSELMDSDLFGHERGAFTGAVSRKLGRFELAEGGTIFLDEIGDLPPGSQVKLLHVLQEQVFERLGGTRTIEAKARVIVATNRDLAKAVQEGHFRADLYYRLNVFPLRIPPLRERKEDIPLLARHFVRQFAAHLNQRPPFISEEVMKLLVEYDWPGNVRELEHTLQRGVILAGEGVIGPEHIALGSVTVAREAKEEEFAILPLEEYERRYLERVLKYTGGVIHGKRGAALLLGMKPTTLRSRLERLGLK